MVKSMIHGCVFPEDLKKSNVVQIHNTESKKFIKNYLPVSLLPILSNFFERLVFNTLLNSFFKNKLFTSCQSGFIPSDSCVSQLLSITHEIYKSLIATHPPI